MFTVNARGIAGPGESFKPIAVERRELGPRDVLIDIATVDEVRGQRVGRQITGAGAGRGHKGLRHHQPAERARRVLAGVGSDEDVVALLVQVQHRHQLVEVGHRPSLVARLTPTTLLASRSTSSTGGLVSWASCTAQAGWLRKCDDSL